MLQKLIPFTDVPPLPSRAKDANKGDFGRVVVIGGSRGMAGAPCLAARAACRAGTGLLLVAVPKAIWDVVATKLDEEQTRGVGSSANEEFTERDAVELLEICEWSDVVVMGPGMSQSEGISKVIHELVDQCERPMVLDADALNAFAGGRAGLIFTAQNKNTPRPLVLTPHPGEMARLLNTSVDEVQADRTHAVRACVDLTGAVTVLKGAETLVSDGRRLYVNNTGNPGMATGGTGDVLAGIIGSLMGQGMPVFDAACLGVYLHGLAGDIGAEKRGMWSLKAGDLIDELPAAFLKHAKS